MRPVIILVPPSENKRAGGSESWDPFSGRFGATLGAARSELAELLAVTDPSKLRVADTLAQHARAVNASAMGGACLPARERYDGVVYRALDYGSLDAAAKERARDQIVVVSGLAGLVGYDDPLPDYRAPFDGRFEDGVAVWRFWRDALCDVLGADDEVIIDLLTASHRRAIGDVSGRQLRVDLHGPKGERGGHGAKFAKGVLIRQLVTHGMEALWDFEHQGWRACGALIA
jgi:hypothetical protein